MQGTFTLELAQARQGVQAEQVTGSVQQGPGLPLSTVDDVMPVRVTLQVHCVAY